MKITLSKEFKRKLSIISILFAKIFQLYIIFTLAHIYDDGITFENITMLIFNIFYILALYFYDEKIDKIFNLRGNYLSLKRENMSKSEINEDNARICKELFEEILDGDFRQ